jgi:hypothetical protein
MKAIPGHHARAGFTLIEVLLGAFLMSGLLLVAGFATDRCMTLFRQRRASQAVTANASRILHRVAGELAFARRLSLQPATIETQGSSALLFQESLGVTDGDVVWSPMITMRWEREPSELDDGADNDGDGLVDEGQAVWIENEGFASERRVILGHDLCEFLPGETFDGADEDDDGLIDERGLCFSIDGDVLTIRLGLLGQGVDGRPIVKVAQTSVFIRN